MIEKIYEIKTDSHKFTLNIDSLVIAKSTIKAILTKPIVIPFENIDNITMDESDSIYTELKITTKDKNEHIFELKPDKTDELKSLREQSRIIYLYIKFVIKK